MTTSLVRDAVRSHWRSTLWWAGPAVAICFWVAAIYPSLRDSPAVKAFLADLPPALLAIFGIDPDLIFTGAGFVQAQLYTLIAPAAMIGLAISLGVRVTAREEERRTMDLLLSLPVTRRAVVLARTAVVGALLGGVALALTVTLFVCDHLFALGLKTVGVVSANLSLWLLGLFFAGVTVAMGALTGRSLAAVGVSASLALASWFVHGFAPLFDWLRPLTAASPFAWALDHQPLLGHFNARLLLLVFGFAATTALAVRLFERRDIATARTLVPGLLARWQRSKERRPRMMFLLRGVLTKGLWDRRVGLWVWTAALSLLLIATFSAWPTLSRSAETLQGFIDSIPSEMLAMFGMTDPSVLATPEGFLSSRAYLSVGPIAMVVFCVGGVARFLHGEERDGRLELVLASGQTRTALVLAKLAAVAIQVVIMVSALSLVVVAGDRIYETDLALGHIVAANSGLGLLGLSYAGIAAALWGVLGCHRGAIRWTVVLVVATYFLNGLGALVGSLQWLRWASPFYWYLGDTPPLARGLGLSSLLLVALTLAGAAVCVWSFARRDLGAA